MCKCFLVFLLFLLLYSAEAQSCSKNNVSAASLLDVYEPFSPHSYANLRIATLHARSIANISAIIYDRIIENKLDVLCISETWINDEIN